MKTQENIQRLKTLGFHIDETNLEISCLSLLSRLLKLNSKNIVQNKYYKQRFNTKLNFENAIDVLEDKMVSLDKDEYFENLKNMFRVWFTNKYVISIKEMDMLLHTKIKDFEINKIIINGLIQNTFVTNYETIQYLIINKYFDISKNKNKKQFLQSETFKNVFSQEQKVLFLKQHNLSDTSSNDIIFNNYKL